MELEVIQALIQCVERYSTDNNSKEQFTKLFQNSITGQHNTEVDSELIYNATYMENLLTNILLINIKTVVKIRMVQKIIIFLWEENQ